MKCPKCKHEWEPREKAAVRREIEDREIDRELGIGMPEEMGGLRGVLPGRTFIGRTSGSDDWDEEGILRDL